MTDVQLLMACAFEDCFELFAYADRMNGTAEGRLYLHEISELAHKGLQWAQAHCDPAVGVHPILGVA